MLVIRLARTGRKKHAMYRLVAADSRRAATGRFVQILGHYNPHTKELVVDKEKTQYYIDNGAQPSNSVTRLLKQEKLKLPEWVQYQEKHSKPKKEAEETPERESGSPAAQSEDGSTDTEAADEQSVTETAQQNEEQIEQQAVDAPTEGADDSGRDKVESAAKDEAQAEAAEKAQDVAAEAAAQAAKDEKSE